MIVNGKFGLDHKEVQYLASKIESLASCYIKRPRKNLYKSLKLYITKSKSTKLEWLHQINNEFDKKHESL